MYKHILYTIVALLGCNIALIAQTGKWLGRVQANDGVFEPEEKICDFIKDGQMRIAPTLSVTPNYETYFRFRDTLCISKNFTLETRIKNSSDLGGLGDLDAEIGFFSNGFKTLLHLVGNSAGQAGTALQVAGTSVTTNNSWMVVNPSDWRTVKMQFLNDTARFYIDGVLKQTVPYSEKICNIDILYIKFKGSGAVDWIRAYDNANSQVYNEDFTDCQKLTPGNNCNPLVPLSITISKPCVGETMTLCANFPAMSYDWGGPNNVRGTSQCLSIPNAKIENNQGIYSLSANVNRCFAYFRQFNVAVTTNTQRTINVDLCFGEKYTLPRGYVVIATGTYYDTLQTKGGCDSVLIYNVRISNSGKDSLTQTICSGQCFTFPSGKKVCQTGIFRDTVRESTGCLKETVVNLKIIDAFTTPNNVTICKGQTYTLPRGRVVSTEGVYRDTLKASGGCDSVILTTLKISDPPQATISGFGTNESPEGTPLTLNTPSVDGGKYEWFLDSVKTTNTQNNINLTLKAGQNFIKVLVTNMFGCKNEATATLFGIPELNIPNAFSPNGDNLNDYFNIVSKLENYYTIQKFQIYNRLGKKIYDNNNGSRGWDGRCNGDDCISDVYIYIIEVASKSGKILKFNGEINLIR